MCFCICPMCIPISPEKVADTKVRKRHQDLAQQYYVRFAMMVQVKGKALLAKEKTDLTSPIAALEDAKQVEAVATMPKTPAASPRRCRRLPAPSPFPPINRVGVPN